MLADYCPFYQVKLSGFASGVVLFECLCSLCSQFSFKLVLLCVQSKAILPLPIIFWSNMVQLAAALSMEGSGLLQAEQYRLTEEVATRWAGHMVERMTNQYSIFLP